MKSIVFVILFLHTVTYAQEKFRIEYQVRFNDQYDRGRADRLHTGYLFINNRESRYYTIQKSVYVPTNERDISMMPDTANQVYTSQEEGRLIAEEMNLKGKRYFVADSLYPMSWELSGEQKMIDSLRCTKATCTFRGRLYTAWFTTDIPLPFGPWKMGGLPGLVVDLQDNDANLVIRLSGINRTAESFVLPTNVTYTIEDHIAELRKLLKRLKSSNRANSSGDCLTCQQESKVEFFTWEKFPE
jgi:GLPGLI family protein